jgi:hypothetical protein
MSRNPRVEDEHHWAAEEGKAEERRGSQARACAVREKRQLLLAVRQC